MPTLIGSAAAFAQSGRMTQLPIPVATAPAIQAALCRNRLRLVEAQAAPFRSLSWSDTPPCQQTPGSEFDEDDGQHENQYIGEHWRDGPRQGRTDDADDPGAGNGALESADAAEHYREKALDQEAQPEIREQREQPEPPAPRQARQAPRRRRR